MYGRAGHNLVHVTASHYLMPVLAPTSIGSYTTVSTVDSRLHIVTASLSTVIGFEIIYRICNLYHIVIVFFTFFFYEIVKVSRRVIRSKVYVYNSTGFARLIEQNYTSKLDFTIQNLHTIYTIACLK